MYQYGESVTATPREVGSWPGVRTPDVVYNLTVIGTDLWKVRPLLFAQFLHGSLLIPPFDPFDPQGSPKVIEGAPLSCSSRFQFFGIFCGSAHLAPLANQCS